MRSLGSEGNCPFGGLFFLEDGGAFAADGAGHGVAGLLAGELDVADRALELGGGEEGLSGGFATLIAVGADVVAVLVLGVADVGDIDAADEADFVQARGDGDQGAAIVALALAAELIFGNLGRLAATGTADAERHSGLQFRDTGHRLF